MIKLFHGNNEFDLHEDIKAIKADLFSADLSDANTTIFQAPDINLPYLQSIVSTVPFMADNRFVMVEGLLSSVEARKGGSSTTLLELENVLKACPPTTYLIFTENSFQDFQQVFHFLSFLAKICSTCSHIIW